jgi:hypothetical protein
MEPRPAAFPYETGAAVPSFMETVKRRLYLLLVAEAFAITPLRGL